MAGEPALFDRFLKGNLGAAVSGPWFDSLALPLVTDWYLPLSRAWAVGAAVGTDTAAFRAAHESHPASDRLLRPVLEAVEARRDAYRDAECRWEASLFGAGRPELPPTTAEDRRRDAAFAFMATRALFLPFHLRRPFAPLCYDIAPATAALDRLALALADPAAAFALPEPLPSVVRSRTIEAAGARQYWIRFPSPGRATGDTAWARVREPPDARDCPSLIFAHGVFMEGEFWKEMSDAVMALVDDGVRVIQPEAPWHGRRRPEGEYGGERVVARAPLGMVELQEALVRELGVLVAWARAAGSRAVGLGGVSLGALSAQLAGSRACAWPAASRPDALLLVATNGSIGDVALEGALARRLALPEAMRRAGWTRERLLSLAPLLEPGRETVVPADRMVVVLGERDDVTPFAGGLALCERWGVPAANRFIRTQGHFSVSLGLAGEPEPLHRVRDLLKEGW